MAGMAGQAGIMHLAYAGMLLQVFGDALGVFAMPLHP